VLGRRDEDDARSFWQWLHECRIVQQFARLIGYAQLIQWYAAEGVPDARSTVYHQELRQQAALAVPDQHHVL
jgi:hypothetical protein